MEKLKELIKGDFIHISDMDLDGMMCTVITKLAFGNKIKTYNCSIQELSKFLDNLMSYGSIKSGDKILLTDLSLNKEDKELFINKGLEIYIIDHHKTTDFTEPLTYGDVTKSACMHYYNFITEEIKNIDLDVYKNINLFVPNYMPLLDKHCYENDSVNNFDVYKDLSITVKQINDSDIFNTESHTFNEGRSLNSLVLGLDLSVSDIVLILMAYINTKCILRQTYEDNNITISSIDFIEQSFNIAVRLILHSKLYGIQSIDKRTRLESKHDLELKLQIADTKTIKFKWQDKNILVMGYSKMFSDIAFHILNIENKDNIDIIISITKHNTLTLRSKVNGFDVSTLASKYGGGGHAAAAGIPIKVNFENLENFKDNVFNILENK